ncbi:MAG: hypothetical protein VX798_10335 [Bacteroidota bacterium]|nr:hypothetical protein [Bacteroidota bacterium]
METKELAEIVIDTKRIQLVDGKFNPTEASDVITSLIDEKINFHKIQRLKIWEGNHHCNTNVLNNRIQELEQEKQIARDIVNQARTKGKSLTINGILEITLED